MPFDTILFIVLGAAAGGFINGLAGTGTALFALGFFLVVLPPVTSVAVVAFLAVLAGAQGLWVVRSAMRDTPARVLRFLVPGLIGVPLGLMLLGQIDAQTLRVGIAVLLIVYGGYFSFRTVLPTFDRRTPWLDASIGFIGGILGGASSVSGAIPTLWLSVRPWPKFETRAVLQVFNFAILTLTIGLLFLKGAYDAAALKALLVAVPTGLVAAQLGIAVFRRLSDDMFRRLLIGLTLVMGVGILASEIL